MHRIGIMQGRLSPPVDGKIQAFPRDTWREEFPLARESGFDLIEWVLDDQRIDDNPIFSGAGRREIVRLQREHRIHVTALCADYFMEYPLISESLSVRVQALGMLVELVRLTPEVGIRQIELPLVGKSSLADPEGERLFVAIINHCSPLFEKQDVDLLLETDLAPDRIRLLFDKLESPRVLLNYDTGNSAYWGYKPQDEIPVYGKRIGNIHIKDCTPEAYSVPLGQGDVDFDLTFRLLREQGYRGDFILQASRGNGHHQDVAREYGVFTKRHILRWLDGSSTDS